MSKKDRCLGNPVLALAGGWAIRGMPFGSNMFSFLKRRPRDMQPRNASSAEMQKFSPNSLLTEPETDENASFINQFMTETAGLRGQIEVARRMSPEEEGQLHASATRLGIDFRLDENYRKYRELWAAEHGEQVYLASVDPPIMLRADEQCCFYEPAVWGQLKDANSRVGYSMFTNRFPVGKEDNYRIGGLPHNHKILNDINEMATGNLIITNKRLFFDGGRLSTTITFQRVANIECYANGIEVSKTTEENDFFQMTSLSSEYAYMIIQEINRLS
jgi:hypothetical protein